MKKKPGFIKAAVLDWLGVPVDLTTEKFWSAIGSTKAGQTVNQDTVLTLSAAYACTRLISETVATLPIRMYERTAAGRIPASAHPLNHIIHQKPNADSTAVTFWESMVAAILLRGNAFAEKQMLGGRLVGLRFLVPGRLSPERVNGRVAFFYSENGRRREIPRASLFWIPGFSLDGLWGVSVIRYGATAFGAALAAEAAASNTFENGLLPTVAFSMEQILKKEQREEFREAMKDISGALHAGKSPILEGGMKAQTIGIDPTDAQLLESRGFGIEEVCRFFRVDPSLIGHGSKDSNWGTGLEQKLIGFLTFTLRTWLTRIEQAINTQLLSPTDQLRYYSEFAIEGLLRADSKARADFYSVMVNNGIYTRDEVRRMENQIPRGGNADVLTVQSAMTPLDSIGQQTDGETARAALAAWLNQGDAKQ